VKTIIPTARRFWLRPGRQILVCLLGVLAALQVVGAGPTANGGTQAEAVFDRMAAAIAALKDYQAEWSHYSATVGGHSIEGLRTSQGKFLREPARSWQKFVKMQDNFHDPTTPGTQLIYDPRTDEILALLPGIRRLLGVVHIFAEDVKCRWLNGEELKTEALWAWLERWQALKPFAQMSLRQDSWQNKPYSVLRLSYPVESFAGRPEINRLEIWVDPEDHLPRRYQGFVPGREEPVFDYQLTRLEPNVGLRQEDLEFEGLELWNFPARFVANAKGLESLRWQPPEPAADATAPPFSELMEKFSQALAQVRDYQAEMVFSEKYFRLKARGKIRVSVIRDPFFFAFELDPDFRINHLHLTSPGGRICFHRREQEVAAEGGGAMRMVGVQTMNVSDPRTFFPFGERLDQLNLFALLDRIQWYAEKGEVATEMVNYHGRVCPRLVLKRKGQPRPAEIQNMAVVLDPKSWLPLRVDYFGNLDPQGFAEVDYLKIETNVGLREADLYF